MWHDPVKAKQLCRKYRYGTIKTETKVSISEYSIRGAFWLFTFSNVLKVENSKPSEQDMGRICIPIVRQFFSLKGGVLSIISFLCCKSFFKSKIYKTSSPKVQFEGTFFTISQGTNRGKRLQQSITSDNTVHSKMSFLASWCAVNRFYSRCFCLFTPQTP